MADMKLKPLALGYAGALLSALCMLLLSVFTPFGVYSGAGEQMMQMHMFYSLGVLEAITGIIEAGVLGFLGGYVLAWFYNKF